MDYRELKSNFISTKLKINTSLPLVLLLFLLLFFGSHVHGGSVPIHTCGGPFFMVLLQG